jgi:hypothetical protein
MPGHSRAAVARIGANATPIMCTVVDISEGGVGLTFVNIAGIPDTFKLEIKGDPNIRSCRVAWRQEPHRMGVAFVGEPQASAADTERSLPQSSGGSEAAFVDAPAAGSAPAPAA